MRHAIHDGIYPSGSLLSLRRIATDTAAPTLDRVETALRDLQGDGLVTISPSGRTRVAGSATRESRSEQIAAWLRFLIRSGVYPPGTVLPSQLVLARILVSSGPDVVGAQRLLADQQVLVARHGRRCSVRRVPAIPVDDPPVLADLVRALRARSAPGPQPTAEATLAACRQTHAWWSRRTIPPPRETADRTATLTAACADLVSRAALAHAQDQEVQAMLRHTAVTALAEHPEDGWEQTWRAACLGALVRLLLLDTTPRLPSQTLTTAPPVETGTGSGSQLGTST
ncbi:hypothetical protein [Streptomyces ziwulingensis]|uniref:hypothetical protein n=1 Tax=Streptomyces ziwulingensis TaxID=1045501 RepID=UPI0031E667D3